MRGDLCDCRAFMTKIVGSFMQAGFRDGTRLPCKLDQMLLRKVARLGSACRKGFGNAAGFTFINAVEPGHGFLQFCDNGRICVEVPPLALKRPVPISRRMTEKDRMTAADARLERQFERISRQVPASRGFLDWVRKPRLHIVRIPLAILLLLGGVFSFLPVLGIWMLPLGLLVLAVDIPPMRRPVGDAIVRLQRIISKSQRWFREKFRKDQQ
jgi:hypothetical protein